MENENLSAGLKDITSAVSQWENQVQECIKQNAELRVTLEKLRADREVGFHDRWHFHEGAYVRTDGYGLFLLQ